MLIFHLQKKNKKHHKSKFDEERAAEMLRWRRASGSWKNQALHKKQTVPPAVQPHAEEVARPEQMVLELQRQLHQGLPVPPTVSLFALRGRITS